jgi:hypothetical protein
VVDAHPELTSEVERLIQPTDMSIQRAELSGLENDIKKGEGRKLRGSLLLYAVVSLSMRSTCEAMYLTTACCVCLHLFYCPHVTYRPVLPGNQ